MTSIETSEVNRTLDIVFRREAGRITAQLARIFGAVHLDHAENAVQDALVKAARLWPIQGIPSNPAGWLMVAARRRVIDLLRGQREVPVDLEALEVHLGASDQSSTEAPDSFECELSDDQLGMLFMCCHPSLLADARVILALKVVCGFSVAEIARAFFSEQEAVAQRIVRAKARLRSSKANMEVPAPSELLPRLDSVLQTIYLAFNEGYCAFEGEQVVRADICREMCRIVRILAMHPVTGVSRTKALAALCFFNGSRLASRLDQQGEVVLLEQQDRSTWDQPMIDTGFQLLESAAIGNEISDYHLMAGISACHAVAPRFEDTDWRRILLHYDQLSLLNPGPVVALNRLVAFSFVHGPAAALVECEKAPIRGIDSYYLLPATLGDLNRRLGRVKESCAHYFKALDLVRTEPEKRFLQRRLHELGAGTKEFVPS